MLGRRDAGMSGLGVVSEDFIEHTDGEIGPQPFGTKLFCGGCTLWPATIGSPSGRNTPWFRASGNTGEKRSEEESRLRAVDSCPWQDIVNRLCEGLHARKIPLKRKQDVPYLIPLSNNISHPSLLTSHQGATLPLGDFPPQNVVS